MAEEAVQQELLTDDIPGEVNQVADVSHETPDIFRTSPSSLPLTFTNPQSSLVRRTAEVGNVSRETTVRSHQAHRGDTIR